jgi:hypothetical protein
MNADSRRVSESDAGRGDLVGGCSRPAPLAWLPRIGRGVDSQPLSEEIYQARLRSQADDSETEGAQPKARPLDRGFRWRPILVPSQLESHHWKTATLCRSREALPQLRPVADRWARESGGSPIRPARLSQRLRQAVTAPPIAT